MLTPGSTAAVAKTLTQAGDAAFAVYLGSGNWKVLAYHPVSTSPLVAAFALRGNATGSPANASDILIASLTQKVTPAAADKIMIADSAASNALKYMRFDAPPAARALA
jgi:hypothetical protein